MGNSKARGGHTSSRNILLILIATLGSFNYGYSNNVIAGSLAQVSFIEKFLTGSNALSLIDAIISGFFGTALIGSLVQADVSDRWGRKAANAVAAILLIIGNALQAGSVHIAMFFVGRYVVGFGGGMLLANTPVYLSEIAPAHNRGLLVGLQGNLVTFGYVVSSLAAFGFHFIDAPYQWRLNFIVATVVALALLVSLISLPESPRWLVNQGRIDEAEQILNAIHKTLDDPKGEIAQAELVQIIAQVEVDRSLPRSWLHILRTPSLRKRTICTLLVWSMAQATSITVLANLTPRLFGALGYDTVLQLGLGVIWTVALCSGCFVSNWLIDRLGRVKSLTAGGFGMVILLAIESALQAQYLDGHNLAGTRAAVAFYFIMAFYFTATLECACYVYGCEIWPTHLRSKGATVSYIGFYVFSIWTTAPAAQAFASIGWKYYTVFIAVTVAMTIPIMLYLPEASSPDILSNFESHLTPLKTAGISLEEIGAKFGDAVAIDFEHALARGHEKIQQSEAGMGHVETAAEKNE